MKGFVSGRINLVLLSTTLMVVVGILVADLPWSASLFVSVAAAVALWMTPRTPTRSIAQLIRDCEAAPARAVARARGVSPAPKTSL